MMGNTLDYTNPYNAGSILSFGKFFLENCLSFTDESLRITRLVVVWCLTRRDFLGMRTALISTPLFDHSSC